MPFTPPILRSACAAIAAGTAAVAVCEQSHAGEMAEDRSASAAKKRALANWVVRASRHGEQFTRWGIAWNRRLDCSRTDAGLLRCQATARPCTIRHVPPTDTIPLRRGAAP
jgi:hypothetical protein